MKKLRIFNLPAKTKSTPFYEVPFPSLRGFEPPAYRLGGGRSIQLSYSDIHELSALYVAL